MVNETMNEAISFRFTTFMENEPNSTSDFLLKPATEHYQILKTKQKCGHFLD